MIEDPVTVRSEGMLVLRDPRAEACIRSEILSLLAGCEAS